MQTERAFPAHRILPLILTIPLVLLVVSTGPWHVAAPVNPSRATVPNQFERHDLPAGWGDDVLQDALPAPPADDDENNRKVRAARIVAGCEISEPRPLPVPVAGAVAFSAVDSLMESLLSGRPPPSSPGRI